MLSKRQIRAVVMSLLAGLAAMVSGCAATATGPAAGSPDTLWSDLDQSARASGGRFTVLLQTYTGADHAETAGYVKDRLAEELGWKDLSVVTAGDHSLLYWGSAETFEQAKPLLKRAREHKAANGVHPFATAIITVTPGSDVGPPEWNLSNCNGEYSLLVAEFQDDPKANYIGRREFAVAYCRQLRQDGYEAYYRHGPSTSSVTVGCFGPDAIRYRKERQWPEGQDQPVIITRAEPAAPELLALMKKFPYCAYNGRKSYTVIRDNAGREVQRKVVPSAPVRVPKENGDGQEAFGPGGRDWQPR